ncbi:MAG TPA: NUDIX domain-containing protein [Candidatus Elarobacter sp.]|nr:NUDIX domain-containing protein [Candidatus Elarobacter sp.]
MSPAGGEAPAVAVDVAVFTVLDRALQLLLVCVRRGVFAGRWALPGGRVHADETLEGAARRLLAAETGVRGIYLEQLYTFGHPERDPHGRVVSVAYFALIPHGGRFQGRAREPFPDAAWCPVARLPPLAYDHRAVVRRALGRLRAKLAYTNLVYTLLPPSFTLGELQEMYEAILGRGLDRRNFRKKILSLGLLAGAGGVRRGPHRPAALYAFRRRRPMMIEILA